MTGVIYVLILIFTGSNKGGVSMQEFNSKASCERALIETNKISPMLSSVKGVCVPK